jgi:hypothetical protein
MRTATVVHWASLLLNVIPYQTTAAEEKMKPRVLLVGIISDLGKLISDSQELTLILHLKIPTIGRCRSDLCSTKKSMKRMVRK